jgi:tankyrase
MSHPKFELLGNKYPFSLEKQFDRVLTKIDQLWDTEKIDDYFCDLIIDKRGGRHGFPEDVMTDILELRKLRESETLKRVECRDDAIQILKARAIDLNKELFLNALINGDKELIDLFVRAGINIHSEDEKGNPSVLIAMKEGYTVIVKILLNAGADIDARDKMGITLLMLACGKSTQSYKEIAELLINKGALINQHDRLGYTPLLLSLSGGSAEIAELLIEKGADVYAQTKHGDTALLLAEIAGYSRIIELIKIKIKQNLNTNSVSIN